MFYVPMVLLIKTSLVYTMIRLWSPYRGKVISLYTFLALITYYYTIILFIKIFTCKPIHLYWDYSSPDRTCLNGSVVVITDSIISAISDLAILIFPIVLTSTLHMPFSKKLHIIAILGAGGTAISFSIYRLVLVICEKNNSHQIELVLKILLSDNAEGGLGLCYTCIPAIKKLLSEIIQKSQGTSKEKAMPERVLCLA